MDLLREPDLELERGDRVLREPEPGGVLPVLLSGGLGSAWSVPPMRAGPVGLLGWRIGASRSGWRTPARPSSPRKRERTPRNRPRPHHHAHGVRLSAGVARWAEPRPYPSGNRKSGASTGWRCRRQ